MNTQPAQPDERARHIERVFLIGPSGSVKSTVAARVASLLAWDCADTDIEVARPTGASMGVLLATTGEPGYRDAEPVALATPCARGHVALARVGGLGDTPGNLTRQR